MSPTKLPLKNNCLYSGRGFTLFVSRNFCSPDFDDVKNAKIVRIKVVICVNPNNNNNKTQNRVLKEGLMCVTIQIVTISKDLKLSPALRPLQP